MISKDKKSAIKILNAARSQKLGDFSILPLKEFVSLKVDLPSVPKIDGVLGPAIDFCSLPKSAKGLDEGLIGKLLIFEVVLLKDSQRSAILSIDQA